MFKVFAFLFISFLVHAEPSVEVWFISSENGAQNFFQKFKNNNRLIVSSKRICQKYGDMCFDPQVGLYHPDGKEIDHPNDRQVEKTGENKFLSNDLSDVVKCDKGQYFDMFCGKSQKNTQGKPSSFEIWVDTSSSLRAKDPGDGTGECGRKSFIKRIINKCSSVDVFVYDTSKKLMGSLDSLCLNYGLNDTKRLIDWIKSSKAKKLLIITDISEMSSEFIDYLDSINAVYNNEKPLFAKDLAKKSEEAKKFCR